MRMIKILSLLVVFAMSLLMISTIKTYAGSTSGVMIFECDIKLIITASDLTGSEDGTCKTSSGGDCEVGDLCADCISACLNAGYANEGFVGTRVSSHTRYMLVKPDIGK